MWAKFHARSAVAAAALSALVACGRSSLFSPSPKPSGAGGGASSSSSSASSGDGGALVTTVDAASSSGAGGAEPSFCQGLLSVAKPILDLSAPPMQDAVEPALVSWADGGGTLALVFRATPLNGGPDGSVRHLDLAPWDAWPSTLGPSYEALPDQVPAFAAAPSPLGESVSIFYTLDLFDMELLLQVPAGQDGPGFSDTVPGPLGMAALFARSDSRLLFGSTQLSFTTPSNDAFYELVITPATFSPPGFVKADNPIYLACAKGSPLAAATPIGKGWLLALGNGRPAGVLGGCSQTELASAPLELQVGFLGPDSKLQPGDSIADTRVLAQVRMAPRPDGAWVAWGREGGAGSPVVQLTRVNSAGKFVVGPVDAESEANTPYPRSVGAASLGNDLALTWADRLSPTSSRINVAVFHSNGTPGPRTSIGVSGTVVGPMDIAASPSGDAVVVTWVEQPVTGAASRIRVARVTCASPP